MKLFIIFIFLSSFIYSQECKDCHIEENNLFLKSAHFNINCENCHINYKKHIEEPMLSNAPYVKENICFTCHKTYDGLKVHKKNSINCLTCHTLNHSTKISKKEEINCVKCHTNEMQAKNLTYRHNLECKECHNPHLQKKFTPSFCTECHIDKKGPFVYEHLPRRAGKCTLCHQPHSSPNPRMLKNPNVSLLCLECHLDISSFHNPSQPVYQNCILCHGEIHGSNKNKNFID